MMPSSMIRCIVKYLPKIQIIKTYTPDYRKNMINTYHHMRKTTRLHFLLLNMICFSLLFLTSCSCDKCKNFNQHVYSFQEQMNKSDKEQQRQLIKDIWLDAGEYEHRYSRYVLSWQKNEKTDIYVAKLAIECDCEYTFCFHKKQERIPITVNIKGDYNFYMLFRE